MGEPILLAAGFDQTQPQIPRRKLDAVEIASHLPRRRQKHDTGGVAKAVLVALVVVAEAHGFG